MHRCIKKNRNYRCINDAGGEIIDASLMRAGDNRCIIDIGLDNRCIIDFGFDNRCIVDAGGK